MRYFDTADIYGQGDSEVFLGRAVKKQRDLLMIGTKVGQHFPAWQQALRPLKVAFTRLVGATFRVALSSAREKSLPRCYEPDYLSRAVEGSLRRLGVEAIDIVYLHSPCAEALADGSAVGALDRLRTDGKVRLVGVSCDDLEAARVAVSDERVRVLQVPLFLDRMALSDLLHAARQRGIGLVGRGVMRGLHESGGQLSMEKRRDAVQATLRDGGVDIVLVGTTNPTHLRELAKATN